MNHLDHGTPAWAPPVLLDRLYPVLGKYAGTTVDFCCGHGSFLAAIPMGADAFGVEKDRRRATRARQITGRQVIHGDALTVRLPRPIHRVVGNWPFTMDFVDALIGRCAVCLPEGGTMHLLLPAYFFKSAARVVGYTGRWEITAELLPYSALFPGFQHPLTWCQFKKGGSLLIGFSLYHEALDIQRMRAKYRKALAEPGHTWRRLVHLALLACGGTASLEQLYAEIQPHRPTSNKWWREQVRKQALTFERVGPSTYGIAS